MRVSQNIDFFIAGGSGLLALNTAALFDREYHIFLALNQRQINLPFNGGAVNSLTDSEEITKVFFRLKPKVVINAAGMTSVEACELEQARAFNANVQVASNLAVASRTCGAKFVHISTDHLFDGVISNSSEQGIVKPMNYYARSKAIAEKRVLDIDPSALIIRTNFFGWGTTYRKSFSDFIIYSLRQNKNINVFDDVFFSPILIEHLSKAINVLIANNATGIYNIVGNDRLSKYNFALKISKIFGLNQDLLIPCSINNFSSLIKRPKDMSLSNLKFSKETGVAIESIDKQLERLFEQESLANYQKIITL